MLHYLLPCKSFFQSKSASMYLLLKQNRLLIFLLILTLASCKKADVFSHATQNASLARNDETNGHLQQTKTFSSDVVVRWLQQQLNMFRLPLPAGTSAPSTDRAFAYSGIALYESVVPGMPAYNSLSGQLTDLPLMPATEAGKAYSWALSANAALASINKRLFSGTSTENKQLMDQLEAELQNQYAADVDDETVQRSIQFGREVADIVWTWAQGDGTSSMPAASTYVLPTGFGLYEKTPPSFPTPVNAFHSMRRQMVPGSRDNAEVAPLLFSFSTDPSSDFYKMAKEVYDISQSLTDEQRNVALYHREGLGYGGGSSIAGQLIAVFGKANATLDQAALALSKVGIGSYEGLTLTFIQKYQFLVMRPITYIRNYMGHPGWNALFGTPPYPEYPAGHPTNGGVLVTMLYDVFGANFSFDVDYYSYLNQPSRHYNSFEELGQEMAIARVYAGIHYKPAVYAGLALGKKVAQNILNNVKFKKE